MSRGQDESLTWLTVAQVDPKKEEAEGELQGRSKGANAENPFLLCSSKYGDMDFPHLPQHASIPEAWHLPSLFSGPGSDLTLA